MEKIQNNIPATAPDAERGGDQPRFGIYVSLLKRLFDFAVAAILLILTAPIFVLTWMLVRGLLGKPAFYVQDRPGRDERIFRIFKFRTMTDTRDASGRLLPDLQRITPFGHLLRKLSIDELPQLWNVLAGDMSLIGPRPLLPRYLPYYTDRERLRHKVRPGITGLAQVSGRNKVGWTERLELDAQYVENCSFALDCKILFLTALQVVKGSDVVAPDPEAMQDLDVERSRDRSQIK